MESREVNFIVKVNFISKFYNGIYVTNIVHVFNVNNSASRLESGKQKNGYYFSGNS